MVKQAVMEEAGVIVVGIRGNCGAQSGYEGRGTVCIYEGVLCMVMLMQ